MVMKKYSMIMGLLIFFLMLAGCSSSSENTSNSNNQSANEQEDAEQETITLNLASAHSPTHSFAEKGIEPFMERVTELTDGQVQFDYYPAEQLGKAADLIGLAQDGATDITYYASPYYPSKMPIGSNLLGMPGLFEDTYQASMAFHTVSQQSPVLENDFLNNGVRPVATYVTPPFDFFTKDIEIKVPEDLKGLKVRSPGGVQSKLLEFVGATPVSVPTPEMYEAFDKGVIDTLYAAVMSLDDVKLNEVIGTGTKGAAYGSGSVGLVISEKKWQELPDNVKEAITQAGMEFTENYSTFILEENEKAIERWISEGITIHEISGAEQEQWQKVAEEFNAKWIEEQNSEDFTKAVEMLQTEAQKY